MSIAVHAFAGDLDPAAQLAAALAAPCREVALHIFPDGETLPMVATGDRTVIAYVRLDHPNPRLMPLLQACDAWRRGGAQRLVLVAPYMPYLRQDAVFAPGQALSRDVFAPLIGAAFDQIVTVEPHLHRTPDLTPVFGRPVTVLTAEDVLAEALAPVGPNTLVIGPDAESQAWTDRLAGRLGAEGCAFQKIRRGDRAVSLSPPAGLELVGREVVLVDDIASSGETLIAGVALVKQLGAARVRVAVVHALIAEEAVARLREAGCDDILSCDSCAHPTNRISLAGLIAGALTRETAP